MIHYHGLPITPREVLNELAGRCFCVPYASPAQVDQAHRIGQSVMLDNGAFTFWRQRVEGRKVSKKAAITGSGDWSGFYDWAEPWLDFATTWAVIPDVIDGDAVVNDSLIDAWIRRGLPKGAPVWHMHEDIDRLKRLAHYYERICVGSSGLYASVGTDRWHRRMEEAFNAIAPDRSPGAWIHMLRGMSLSGSNYPFASVDSTDIARNHWRRNNVPVAMADRWDAQQCPARWRVVDQLEQMGLFA